MKNKLNQAYNKYENASNKAYYGEDHGVVSEGVSRNQNDVGVSKSMN